MVQQNSFGDRDPRGRRLDKNLFFKDVGYIPHPKQLEIHDCKARFRLAACGVRFGKSYCAAFEALAQLMYPGQRGWIVAPSYDLTDKVFREVYAFSLNHLKEYIVKESLANRYLKFAWGSEIYGKSADNPMSLAGESLDFVIIDEAPALKEVIWTHFIRERLTDRKGWALFIGTPKGRNWYYNLYMNGQDPSRPEYQSFHYTSYDNPYLDPKELDDMRRQIPDRAFRQEALAEFLSEEDAVFRHIRDNIRDCLRPAEEGHSYVGGVDLAKYQDYTVITIADKKTHEVVFYDRWNRCDWTITYDRIAKACRAYNATCWVDSTGIGDPIYEALSKKPYSLKVKPFKFTSTSKGELVDNLAWFFENGQLKIPAVDEMINELEIYEYSKTGTGRYTFSAPSGYHDDIVCSLGLTCLGLSRQKDFYLGDLDLRMF